MNNPRATLNLIFDGGSLGNPGKGYGSFQLTFDGTRLPIKELEFGNDVTNNQAEYRTLLEGLNEALHLLDSNNISPRDVVIDILTDSKLVVEQVNGRWKVKNAGLKPLCQLARERLTQFGQAQLTWHPRAKSFEVLGH